MDIWAKRIPADKNGVRIAQLTEKSYRHNLWTHRHHTGLLVGIRALQDLPAADALGLRLVRFDIFNGAGLPALVDKGLVTDQLTLTVGYDIENLTDPDRRKQYRGEVKADRYGRSIPKHAHGTANLEEYTDHALCPPIVRFRSLAVAPS